jgi:hypothetical protein
MRVAIRLYSATVAGSSEHRTRPAIFCEAAERRDRPVPLPVSSNADAETNGRWRILVKARWRFSSRARGFQSTLVSAGFMGRSGLKVSTEAALS